MEDFIRNIRELTETRKDCLYWRQNDVLNLLYGLEDGILRTPGEVARLYGCTPERIRKIKKTAIRRLERNMKTKKVRDFYC